MEWPHDNYQRKGGLRMSGDRLVRGSSPGWEVRAAITSEPEGVPVK